MSNSGEKESTPISDLWDLPEHCTLQTLTKDLTPLSEACCRDGDSKVTLAQRCHPQHHSALFTPIQMPATRERVTKFLSKGNSL